MDTIISHPPAGKPGYHPNNCLLGFSARGTLNSTHDCRWLQYLVASPTTETIWDHSWCHWDASEGILGPSEVILGSLLELLGTLSELMWAHLGSFWRPWGSLFCSESKHLDVHENLIIPC